MKFEHKGHKIEIKEVKSTWHGVAEVGGGFEFWIDGTNETIKLLPSQSVAESEATHFVDAWLES